MKKTKETEVVHKEKGDNFFKRNWGMFVLWIIILLVATAALYFVEIVWNGQVTEVQAEVVSLENYDGDLLAYKDADGEWKPIKKASELAKSEGRNEEYYSVGDKMTIYLHGDDQYSTEWITVEPWIIVMIALVVGILFSALLYEPKYTEDDDEEDE